MSDQILYLMSSGDTILSSIINTIPKPIIKSSNDIFFDLVSCIAEQQIHYRGKGTLMKKLFTLLNDAYPTPQNIVEIDEKAFSEAKLSNTKYQTLMRLAEKWENEKMGDIDWKALKDEEVKNILTSITGIGNWTADMILLYSLQRPDIFPFDDYHLKDIMVKEYKLNPKSKLKAQMLDISNNWSPYKSLAVKYLLAWKEYLKKPFNTK